LGVLGVGCGSNHATPCSSDRRLLSMPMDPQFPTTQGGYQIAFLLCSERQCDGEYQLLDAQPGQPPGWMALWLRSTRILQKGVRSIRSSHEPDVFRLPRCCF